MAQIIRLDNDADNEASSKNGHAYIIIDDKCVHCKYDSDYRECGERNEYWGGHLAVEGDSWIEVDSVTNLSIVEILDIETDDLLPLGSYVMTADDTLQIIEIIKDFIEGNIEASQPANSYYAA
ncbi:hypothetical protein Psyc_0984 [Psychrobacter arcticus 273-4]|uniref:Uncharacterized protein n=1 Tax=Psychrobacter arcticus (strain DSM 17307 / VKM B-2377 / 273-4) TaxID=259536 RepID=Q4FT21_PSYA2|nr:hypothetical protein [Psychrobacter arcticus]AAZ18837.1 hypothetical protein Psyc_0984 [Psychrobacter arcticus 273-4]